MLSWVYFARRVDGKGLVKIGSSCRLSTRLQALSLKVGRPLYIAAKCPGDYRVEYQFQNLFDEQHSHGEWFHPSERLDATIAELNAGTFNFASLPAATSLLRSRIATESWRQRRQRRAA